MAIFTAVLASFGIGVLTQRLWDKARAAYLAKRSASLYAGGLYWLDALDSAPPRPLSHSSK